MDVKTAYIRSTGIFVALKKWEKAIPEYEKIIELFGDDALIYEQLHMCYQNIGELFKSKESLTKAIKFTPPEKTEKLERLKDKYRQLFG